MKARQPWQIKLTDDEFKPIWPTLLLDWIEWEGPVQESWPPPAHQRLFFAGEGATKDLAYAREILARFAAEAYRRPVRPDEVDRLVKLVENAQKLGDNFESSVKTGLIAVLCSSNFLYLVEGSPDTPVADAERLGACFAALLFPLEHHARRAAARAGAPGQAARTRRRCAAKCGG